MPAFDPQLGTEIRESFAEPNWAQWVQLNLEMIKSDGSLLKMEMLRSGDWVLENIDYQVPNEEPANTSSTLTPVSTFLTSFPVEPIRVPLRPLFAQLQDVRQLLHELDLDSVVVTLDLDLPEIGVRGEAVVTGVEPCPLILPGPGKVVLTTFHHASSDLIDLYLSPQPPTGVDSPGSTHLTSTSSSPTDPLTTLQTSEEALLYPRASRATSIDPSWERIGVTGNHPIWSQDCHDYVAAMDLRIGERLKNLSGDTVWVQRKLPRPGPTPVYNLEVQDEHVYYVGTSGVLAHNAGDKYSDGLGRGMRDRGPKLGQNQGREERLENLAAQEFDNELPRHVRGWLENERRRLEYGNGEYQDGPITPPGYVQAHGRSTPAREGFDYTNSRLQLVELNKLEEKIRRKRNRGRR